MKEQETYQPLDQPGSHPDENDLGVCAEYLCNLRADLPDDLRKHLEECPHCRAEAMAIADLITQLPSTLHPSHITRNASRVTRHASRLPRHASRLARLIASLAAVFLLAWFIQLIRNRQDSKETEVASLPADSLAGPDTPQSPALYAQAFSPNLELEHLITVQFRHTDNPHPAGPANNQVFHRGDTLVITWTPLPHHTYGVILLNNRSHPLLTTDPLAGGQLLLPLDLTPGLYYWKFMSRNELWKVGKFLMK